MSTLSDFCLRILESPDLESKLDAPRDLGRDWLSDAGDEPLSHPLVERPVRAPGLAMGPGAGRLPPLGELGDRDASAKCLARFAHHELMAVELFAWALLRWPALPIELRREFLRVLQEEQVHCRLYLGRLAALGFELEEFRHSDYFWKQAPAIASSPHGPRAFLCAVGLTFEQANLDFSLLYRDAYRRVGDEQTAQVCQRIHEDEIGHVALAAHWNLRLAGVEGLGAIEAYEQAVPFPLSAVRAKGRNFCASARRRAGLPEGFIEFVRTARPNTETTRGVTEPSG